MKTVAIILAAGSGKRFGSGTPKQFLKVGGKPLLAHTIQRFEDTDDIDEIFVVTAEEQIEFVREKIIEMNCFGKVTRVIAGGATRAESTRNALAEIPDDITLVAVHDGARPMTASSDIARVISVARKHKAAVLVTPVSDTIKRADKNVIVETVDRTTLFSATTPQVFDKTLLIEAHNSFPADDALTDDSLVVERHGVKPQIVIAEYPNPKVTTALDLELVKVLLKNEKQVALAKRKER